MSKLWLVKTWKACNTGSVSGAPEAERDPETEREQKGRVKRHFAGRCLARLVEQPPHVHGLGPCRGGTGFGSDPRPFAAKHICILYKTSLCSSVLSLAGWEPISRDCKILSVKDCSPNSRLLFQEPKAATSQPWVIRPASAAACCVSLLESLICLFWLTVYLCTWDYYMMLIVHGAYVVCVQSRV